MAITKKAIIAFFFLLVTATLLGSCVGTVHKVGDSEGWTMGVDYYNWVTSRHFRVGDSLVFEYNKDFNDVTEVTDPLAFEFCNPSLATARYRTGYDVVHLTRPGYHYFFGATPGHCAAKQMFGILVVQPRWPELDAQATQSLVSPSNTSSSSSSSSTAPSPVAEAPVAYAPLHNAASDPSPTWFCSSLLDCSPFVLFLRFFGFM